MSYSSTANIIPILITTTIPTTTHRLNQQPFPIVIVFYNLHLLLHHLWRQLLWWLVHYYYLLLLLLLLVVRKWDYCFLSCCSFMLLLTAFIVIRMLNCVNVIYFLVGCFNFLYNLSFRALFIHYLICYKFILFSINYFCLLISCYHHSLLINNLLCLLFALVVSNI